MSSLVAHFSIFPTRFIAFIGNSLTETMVFYASSLFLLCSDVVTPFYAVATIGATNSTILLHCLLTASFPKLGLFSGSRRGNTTHVFIKAILWPQIS